MPELSSGGKAGLRYFGAIWGAVNDRAPTQAIWAAIHAATEAFGAESSGITIQVANELRSYAGGLRNARDALTKAPDSYPIDGSMIGTAPWSRGLADQNALGMWQARFEHSVLRDGIPVTEMRTVTFTGSRPETAGELRGAVEDDALSMADKYNEEHVSIGDITLIGI